jgi:hypothetical protein
MTRLVGRLLFPTIMATLLTGSIAWGTVAWSAGTSCGSSTYKICVSLNDGNGLPRATTNLNDSTYVGDYYYNSEQKIDNSVSSMQNWYSSSDVLFYWGAGYTGSNMCVDSLYGYTSISYTFDDSFTSHLIVADTVC